MHQIHFLGGTSIGSAITANEGSSGCTTGVDSIRRRKQLLYILEVNMKRFIQLLQHINCMMITSMLYIPAEITGRKNEFPTYVYREDMRIIGQILTVRRICRKF